MKLKSYLIQLLTALLLMSCSKDDDPGIKEPDLSPDATFSLAVESVKTKAATTDPKDRITKLSVVLYIGGEYYTMKDSVLPADKINDLQYSINEVVNIPIKSGNTKVLVLANAGNSAAFMDKSLEEALKIKTEGLTQEIHSHLTMSSDVMDMTLGASVHNYLGYNKANADGIKVISSSPVLLYRNVARIQLSQLSLKKATDYGTAVKFILKNIYIANAKSHSYLASKNKTIGGSTPNWGTVEVDAENTAGFWWAGVKGNEASEFDKLTFANTVENSRLNYDFILAASNWTGFAYHDENSSKMPERDVVLNFELPGQDLSTHKNRQGEDNLLFAIGNFFYTYENLDPLEGEKTILTLKGDYTYIPNGGAEEVTVENIYYSVVVNGNGEENQITGVAKHNGIKRNTKYSLDLTIKGPGSSTPDLSERAYLGAKVKVVDWNTIFIDANVD